MIREATAEDRDAILALRRRCFPEHEAEHAATRAFIAEEDGRPVAHLGLIEQTYVLDGRSYPGALAVDAMTDPEYRRRGLFDRVAAFARETIRRDYALSAAWQIRRPILEPMMRNGWMPVLKAPVLVKPLLWKKAPRIARQMGAPLRDAFLARYAHVHHESRFDERYTITEDGAAYLVTRHVILKGRRTLAIIDVAGNAKNLMRHAFAHADEPIAAALISWRHPSVPLLLRMGFLPSPHRFRFLVNVFDSSIDAKRAHWALTWADTDHL